MKITFLGGGNMANALISGLLKQNAAAAVTPSNICVIDPIAEARTQLTATFGVRCFPAVTAETLACDVLVLAVKPQQMREALAPISSLLTALQPSHQPLIVSIAAGTRAADLSRWLGGYTRLVRTMPNTPALIGAGITGLYAHPAVTAEERQKAETVLRAAGKTLWVEDEKMMDAVTAISGSGPAYVFYFIEAMAEAARGMGFSEEQAKLLSVETFVGASALAAGSAEDVATLRQRVTSKGGTTEAALNTLENDAVKAAIIRAAQAAALRGQELGDMLGKD